MRFLLRLPPFVLAIFGGMCARTGCGRPARRWYCSDACGNAARQQRHRSGPPTAASVPMQPGEVEMTFTAEWCIADDAQRYKHMEGYRQTARGRWRKGPRTQSDADLVRTLLEMNGGGGEL